MSHYFLNDANLKSEIKDIDKVILNHKFIFSTDNGVFSKGEVDFGTQLLIENVLKKNISGNLLDLGCGYGVIGIVLGKLCNVSVTMCDVNKRALHLTKINAKKNGIVADILESDGYCNINKTFDYVISNPPIRIGKDDLYKLLIDTKKHLNKNGELIIVVRKEQGALSLIRDMGVYYCVNVIDKQKGFLIISLKND